jgi:predicted nucleic acid-binding protein
MMKLFVDTWGWVVLKDSREPRHNEAVSCFAKYQNLPGGIVTSDYVLDETFTLVFARRPFHEAWRFAEGILKSEAKKLIWIERVGQERFSRTVELRKHLADKPRISFTDLSSMVIMMELGIRDVLTADQHFSHAGFGFHTLPD